jgi:thymidylate synthase (FAD)
MFDKWSYLRQGLWANVEPNVKLVGLSVPVLTDFSNEKAVVTPGVVDSGYLYDLIANSASVSTGVEIKDKEALIKRLITLGHHTPLESIQFNFHVSGISNASGAQISRHRVGQAHVSSSRRYQEQGVKFVYPILDNVDSEDTVKTIYSSIADSYKAAYDQYLSLRHLGVKKGDARYVIPTASAQERNWWINARALRDFFRLRLELTAEAEIRRLSFILLRLVYQLTPSLFEDIYQRHVD